MNKITYFLACVWDGESHPSLFSFSLIQSNFNHIKNTVQYLLFHLFSNCKGVGRRGLVGLFIMYKSANGAKGRGFESPPLLFLLK